MNQAETALKTGRTIVHREGGNSMSPTIKSREPVVLEPVTPETPLRRGDIVFCRVRGNYYTHRIKAVRTESGGTKSYLISNLRGRENGWIGIGNIFGRVVAIGAAACAQHKREAGT